MKFTEIALAVAFTLTASVGAHATSTATAVVPKASTVQKPGGYRFAVGDVQIVALSDGTVPQDLHTLLKGVDKDHLDKLLAHNFQKSPIELSIGGYLIQKDGRNILVDTGVGTFFGPGVAGKLVSNLEAMGVSPQQVSDILLTHIHTDHSGGLVDAAGKRVFPNATVHVGKPDVDFFLDPKNQNGTTGYDKTYFQQATASIGPYVKAGKIKAFSAAGEVLAGITAKPTPGHTPGSALYTLSSKGQDLTFVGDLFHVESVQMPQPGITIVYDVNQDQAAAQRKAQFADLAKTRRLIAAPHLPYPGIGYIRQDAPGRYAYVPLDFLNRQAD